MEEAKEKNQGIVFEDIRNIRRMYQKGNYQEKDYRRQMNNHWPFAEIMDRIKYKAQWSGVLIIHLTKSETRGTSSLCYQCGERLQGDRAKPTQLWFQKCEKWFDRGSDCCHEHFSKRVVEVRPLTTEGEAGEAMVQEPSKDVVILRVDASKSISERTGLTYPPKS